ncbi:4'-phosphopantetheinyl transferase superfamily protein [Cyanobacterium stanieri LEGE 03274]|uniref:4'-phosphopantetheinyl transferase superfamily protein n=1 Tax=Cyanobacterium stanieri LEGE 03274 TaxID=1828756 RepID=A0ABR9V2W1_9CHRO|nr:4'-phosphopantetheinyl transferase superfamily protein [Cyanobacterium stanieri]MBE9222237.1 4'-phosphopantetheinyl transferase superfamily protein [Cyanobacterium stanieri LEGE 03274]
MLDLFLLNTNNFSSDLTYFKSLLSPDELDKIERFKNKLQGDRTCIARANLRIILSKHLNINPDKIIFNYNQKGKPFLKDYSNLYFNLSHTDNWIIYGISNQLIGVDIENISKQVKFKQLAQRFFCPSEYALIDQVKPENEAQLFYTFWTAKEAYLKAIGEGLSGGLDSIELSYNFLSENVEITSAKIREEWQIKNCKINDNYLVSVAVKSKDELPDNLTIKEFETQ